MVKCLYCQSRDVIKRGKQKTKSELKQVYYCKDCQKRFVLSWLKKKSFSPRVILEAISFYNLGNTLAESSKLVNRKFKVKTSKSSVSNWLKEFKNIYSYHRIRERVLQSYRKEVIASKLFKHNGLTYNYKFHRAKLEMFGKKYKELVN